MVAVSEEAEAGLGEGGAAVEEVRGGANEVCEGDVAQACCRL
jgi:hypothetical protein